MKLSKKQAYPNIADNVRGVIPPKETLMLMPRELVEEFRAFVFENNGEGVKIAAVDPRLSALRNFAKKRFSQGVKWFLATESDISFILKNYVRDFQEEISRIITLNVESNGNIVALVDSIINYALSEQVSDIHIEPKKNELAVRFRIDGILQTVLRLPPELHPAVIARFKILANLKIDDSRHPQDGRIEPEKFSDLSFRISTIPTLYGEKIALRVLDDSHKELFLQKLGFSEEQEKILLRNIEKPFGLIINSGPTGSGKTTTLYALLSLLSKERVNISTLEDPIEYALAGVNQIQVNPKFNLTFASGLRSLLRQDPDVIMVGEIRDSETAIMAVEAALTGHLVLTTLHTNDAPSAFTRLLEMKVEDFAITSVVNVVIAQRLLRRICDKCAKKEKLDDRIVKKITERKDVTDALKAMKKNTNDLISQPFLAGGGCDACKQTGYSGRIGIFEVLELNKEIHDLILEHAPTERIGTAAKKTGFRDMMADGIEKVFAGITTFEELLRITRNA